MLNPLLREKGVKSLLGAPLMVGGQILGVVHVGTLTPRAFTEQEAELLQLAADRAALAIEHGRLFESERALANRLRKLQEVTDVALTHLSSADLLDELVIRVREILEADTCAILLLDESRNEVVARAAAGLEEEVEAGVRIPLGQGFAGRLAAERKVIALEDVDHSNVLNPILREKGIKSLLGAPLLARGHVLRRDPRRLARAAALHAGRGRPPPDGRRASGARDRACAAARPSAGARPRAQYGSSRWRRTSSELPPRQFSAAR